MKTFTRSLVIVFLLIAVFNLNKSLVHGEELAPFAASYVVNTTVDELDLSGSGTGCSLREAIQSADLGYGIGSGIGGCVNNGGSPTTIYVPGGTYSLDMGTDIYRAGEDGGTIGDLDIYTGMSIFGDGIGVTIIDGVNTDRVFDIFAGL